MTMMLNGEGLRNQNEHEKTPKVRAEEKKVMSRIGELLREAFKNSGTNSGKELIEESLRLYQEKKDVVLSIYEEQNENRLDHHTQNLSGLRYEEAASFAKKLVTRAQKMLNGKQLEPNVGDSKHHMLKVIWGKSGLSSGFQRMAILNSLGVLAKMREDVMYILLKAE